MTGKWAGLAAGVGAILLAYLVVDRLDSQSLAFMSGVACGVVGSVPAVALCFWFYYRQKPEEARAPDARERLPQIIMIPAAQQPYVAQGQSTLAMPSREWPTREFTIVGEEGREDGPA
jgi:hypothetical protein